MTRSRLLIALLASPLLSTGCAAPGPADSMRIARLDEDGQGLDEVREAFREANPGCDLSYEHAARELTASASPRIVFVQGGETQARVSGDESTVGIGDIVLLRPGEELRPDGPLDLLIFDLPTSLPTAAPTFIRPDWDENITDTPGGCATETGAYRRILLTWLPTTGPYVFHGLNAHRVRITDSFTHYHPSEGGFDEFYLVQGVLPGARILTSDAVDAIEKREVTAREAKGLMRSTSLAVGDLVYLPRGTIHRGLDGVLAQVIAVPGFRPGTEIGVDTHLQAIGERFGLGSDELPFHRDAATNR